MCVCVCEREREREREKEQMRRDQDWKMSDQGNHPHLQMHNCGSEMCSCNLYLDGSI